MMVLDASVLFLTTQDALQDARAAEVQSRFPAAAERETFVAPNLLAYEMTNLVHGARGPVADLPGRNMRLARSLAAVTLFGLDAEGLARIADLMHRHRLTAYDASYLELAQRLGARLCTEDQKLLRAARDVLGKDRAATLAGL